MRQWVDEFVKTITKKKFNEKKWYDVDYYSPVQVIDLIRDRYQIVFWQPKCRYWKIEIWENWIEELYRTREFGPGPTNTTQTVDPLLIELSNKEAKELMASYPDGICKYLEVIYIYIINKK